MRLLHPTELRFQEFFDCKIPRYAILSHRWEDQEVSYQEIQYLLLSESNREKFLIQEIHDPIRTVFAGHIGWMESWQRGVKLTSAMFSETVDGSIRVVLIGVGRYQAASRAVAYPYLTRVDDHIWFKKKASLLSETSRERLDMLFIKFGSQSQDTVDVAGLGRLRPSQKGDMNILA